MILGDRLAARLQAQGLSQSELARRVGIAQQTVFKLISGASRGSTHLHKIARELGTTPAFLTGETDDPDANAPPPPPAPIVQHIMMPVALPSERALARMFEGLLEAVDRSAPVAELARELAQLLPTGLTQLRGRLIEPTTAETPEESTEALATDDRALPR